MPLVRIDLRDGRPSSFLQAVSQAVHESLVSIGVPADDRFHVINEHAADGFIFDSSYLGISRTESLIIIQITLNEGRSVDLKKKLYKSIADLLHENVNVRREDIFVNLVEVKRENWSFGNGEAQYAT